VISKLWAEEKRFEDLETTGFLRTTRMFDI
jgi:hypothetical protein